MRILVDCRTGSQMLADRDLLLRVLTNLINNAVKYASGGRTIALSCQSVPRFVQVSVEDEGPGIVDDALPKLFQPFTRVGAQEREQSGGTGIGLSLCRAIIEQHEGQIWAENRRDRPGSRFLFTVPVPLA
jgi:signal transduction histidine kinase